MRDQGAIAYVHAGAVYLNLTNRCPVACRFCVKRAWRWDFRGRDLKLGREEPSAAEAWDAARGRLEETASRELVFCGYGECTYRLDAVLGVSRRARRCAPDLRLRLNTIGLGSLLWERDIVPELADALDAVSVSLNTADPAQWIRLHAPRRRYAAAGFRAVLDFTAACVLHGLETTVTAVDQPGVDLEAVERLAASLGARFRPRPPL
ncbi:MAG: radical SAM protein [Elusimicrobia bacterium]|nr:radical SAM protein [Elusimicrobiota bacterium]